MERKITKKLVKEFIEDLKNIEYVTLENIYEVINNNIYEDIYQEVDFWQLQDENGIISCEQLEDMLRQHLEEYGLEMAINLVNDIKYSGEEYFYINGYGHCSNLDNDSAEDFKNSIIQVLTNEYLEKK